MEIKTTPVCRAGWEGKTLAYTVKADGATEIALPAGHPEHMQARIVESKAVDGGVEAKIEVEILSPTAY